MIPLSTLMDVKRQPGTEITNRFNLFRSSEISGVPAPGYTSGQALAALEEVFKATMPAELGFAYSSMSYQEKVAPPAAPTLAMSAMKVSSPSWSKSGSRCAAVEISAPFPIVAPSIRSHGTV